MLRAGRVGVEFWKGITDDGCSARSVEELCCFENGLINLASVVDVIEYGGRS